MGDDCIICGKPVPDFIPKYCCSNFDCGCGGQPLSPCVCSATCGSAVYDFIGLEYDERRKRAGIEKWNDLADKDAGDTAIEGGGRE
jgi:hypothetical protein